MWWKRSASRHLSPEGRNSSPFRCFYVKQGNEAMPSDILLNERSLYDAIYWHTTGNPSGGDALGHVVFLADELDPILSTGANDRTWRGRSPSLTVIAG